MSEATRAARKGCGFAAKLFGPGGILAATPALYVAVKATSTPNSRPHDHYGLIKMLQRHILKMCHLDTITTVPKTHVNVIKTRL